MGEVSLGHLLPRAASAQGAEAGAPAGPHGKPSAPRSRVRFSRVRVSRALSLTWRYTAVNATYVKKVTAP